MAAVEIVGIRSMTSSIKGKIAVLRDIFESVILKLNENNFDTTIARRMEIIHSRIEELHKAYKPNEEVSYEQMRTTVNDLIELTEHGDFYAVLESILTKDERTIL